MLGLNRWVLRVGAYAALMTREYPPFRLDTGELDTASLATTAAAPRATGDEIVQRSERWGPGRVLAVVLGSVLALVAAAFSSLVASLSSSTRPSVTRAAT